jgi:CheY-like chemotaxis protein
MLTSPRKFLILIADDRASSRELLRLVLERAGYEVVEAEDGEQALSRARAVNPDLILLDLQMPALDGYGVLAALRSEARFENLPVLALTASAMRGDRERIIEAGFTDYLAKPAGPEVLRETVARLLQDAATTSVEREESA